jgi:hypothetical protein
MRMGREEGSVEERSLKEEVRGREKKRGSGVAMGLEGEGGGEEQA